MADASKTSVEDALEQARGMMAFDPMLAPRGRPAMPVKEETHPWMTGTRIAG